MSTLSSGGAQSDYRDIVEYLLDVKRSPQAARGFVDEFDRQLDIVCDNPFLHALSRMPELASLGYRPFFTKPPDYSKARLHTLRTPVKGVF